MFKDYLIQMRACREAIAWVGDKSSSEAWSQCENPDWMFWLLRLRQHVRKDGWPTKEVFIQLAIDFARSVLHLVSEEDRALKAIEAAEKWLADPSEENRLAAARAADAAVAHAAAPAVAYAARAAARAAAYAAAARAAARAAAYAAAAHAAADAAAHAAVRAAVRAAAAHAVAVAAVAVAAYADASAVQKEQAQMIRNRVPAIPVCE